MSFAHVDLESFNLLIPSKHSVFHTTSASPSTGFSEPRVEGFDGDIPFRDGYSNVPLSLSE